MQQVTEEHQGIIAAQRDEIERLQSRCADLSMDKAWQRAAVAWDLREFCTANCTDGLIPLNTILEHLHRISDGLVPSVDRIKRNRLDRGGEDSDDERRLPRQQELSTAALSTPTPPTLAEREALGSPITRAVRHVVRAKRCRDDEDDAARRKPRGESETLPTYC